jgi:hypothetical protein
MGKWSLEGTLSHRQVEYSAVEYNRFEYRQNVGSLGLVYRPSGALSLGMAYRHTDGSYPFARFNQTGSFVADDYKRRDVDLTANWVASGASTVNARLSFGKLENQSSLFRDFSGTTGALTWRWSPGPRLTVNTTVSRDTGQETSFLNFSGTNFVASDTSRLTNALQSTVSYELTGKIVLDASVRWNDRTLTNAFGAEGNDSNRGVSLGARWAATRNSQLGCQVAHDSRSSDSAALSIPFSATSTSCYAQITLR